MNSTNDRGLVRTDVEEAAHQWRLVARIKRTEAKRYAELCERLKRDSPPVDPFDRPVAWDSWD